MEKIKILNFETKISTTGKPYFRVNTSQGFMSVFDNETMIKLPNNIGKEVFAEIVPSLDGKYKNIRSIKDEEVKTPEKSSTSSDDKPSFYVSYAKDIYIAFLGMGDKCPEKPMETAISVIKQAREAF